MIPTLFFFFIGYFNQMIFQFFTLKNARKGISTKRTGILYQNIHTQKCIFQVYFPLIANSKAVHLCIFP